MKRITLFLLFFAQVAVAQYPSNTVTQTDTTGWQVIRYRINNESLFLKQNPSAERFFNRGALKRQIEDYQGAIEDFTQAIQLLPTNGAPYYYRGGCHERLGELKKAKSDFTKVTQLQPDFEWAWSDLGIINTSLKNFD